VLLSLKVPYVKDENKLKKLYPKSDFKFLKNGEYIRTLDANKSTDEEMLFGNPKV